MEIFSKTGCSHSPLHTYVATVGFFDGVHRGHRFLIELMTSEARLRNMESVVVTFPDSPARVIHPGADIKLLSTAEEKVRRLHSLGVDHVVLLPFTETLAACSTEQFMTEILQSELGVSVLVMGYDHRFGHAGSRHFEDYKELGQRIGMEVTQAGSLSFSHGSGNENVSSSAIREALLTGNIAKANQGLGYDYTIEGTVVGGYHVGATLGYPTANLAVVSRKLVPHGGVYAVRVEVEGRNFSGMLNIGHRPTLDNGRDLSVEVHIFDFHENIYAETVRLSFVKFLREERKFESIEALRLQLEADERRCRKELGC